MMPADGFIAYTPQYDAGLIVDPLVCEPMATGTSPEATAAAEPDDDPPGECSKECGFLVLDG